MPHPLVHQLRFTRAELLRALDGVAEQDAQRQLLPMNCISWIVGHLAWQEQRYFLTFAQGLTPAPELNAQFAYGAPACAPPFAEVLATWRAVTGAADQWLEQATTEGLLHTYTTPDGAWSTNYGNLLQRVIYHYWYHIGEAMAIRQQLGHPGLPDFVGDIDDEAPFQSA
jgi:uncharacterized damage-inducible protein DinB